MKIHGGGSFTLQAPTLGAVPDLLKPRLAKKTQEAESCLERVTDSLEYELAQAGVVSAEGDQRRPGKQWTKPDCSEFSHGHLMLYI